MSIAPQQLTRATLLAHDDLENFYAPLIGLVDAETGAAFALGNAYVLLTNPLRFPDAITNWERAGVAVPALLTAVIRSDAEFDALVAGAFYEGMGVVIDPILDAAGEPVAAFVVRDFEAMMEHARQKPQA